MNEDKLKEQCSDLWKMYDSLGEAHEELKENYNNLVSEFTKEQLKTKSLLKQIEVRDRINQSTMQNQNKQNNDYLTEIQRLRNERDKR